MTYMHAGRHACGWCYTGVTGLTGKDCCIVEVSGDTSKDIHPCWGQPDGQDRDEGFLIFPVTAQEQVTNAKSLINSMTML